MKKGKVENHINYYNFVLTQKNKKTGKATKFKTLKQTDEKIVIDWADQRNLNPKSALRKQRQLIFMERSQKIQELTTCESAKYKYCR